MSVFSKIFLSFWLALIVTIVLTTFMHPFGGSRPPVFREPMVKLLTVHARAVLQDIETGRHEEVVNTLESLRKASGIQLYLFDAEGNEITGRPVPQEVQLAVKETESEPPAESNVLARPVNDDHGKIYTMAAQFVGRPHRRYPPPAFYVPRLALLFVVSGIVCFVLARYLTSPLVRLRAAAQKFAKGELQARAVIKGSRRDEAALLVTDFNRMAERIEKLITAQRRLLSDISHELRSPLARLNIATELLRKKTGPEASAMLDRVERETARLDQLIGQLLTLSSFESGERQVERAEVDLIELVSEIASDADYEARHHSCRVSFAADGSESCITQGDRELLHSAIENVVRNAVRYTAEGSTVEISMQTGLPKIVKTAALRVRDHGPGIPEAELANIFRPFYRLADARDRQSGGVGLGLAISQRAVRLHGGDVVASNAPDGGLVVEIRLPSKVSFPAPIETPTA